LIAAVLLTVVVLVSAAWRPGSAAPEPGGPTDGGSRWSSLDGTGATVAVRVDEIVDTGHLMLVNRDHAVADEPVGPVVEAWPTVPVAGSVWLEESALEAVGELFAAAREEGVGALHVTSGYRDRTEQARIYAASDTAFAQPPGHSEHQTGLAVDILPVGVSQSQMAASREGRWLADNAWKHGLVLRYPDGKQDVTGIAYEPWHFRYVGQPHAWFCQDSGLSYEEYIRFLKDSGGYRTTVGGTTYSVLYQVPRDGIIFVPEGREYLVSGDNTGGYVVTVREP